MTLAADCQEGSEAFDVGLAGVAAEVTARYGAAVDPWLFRWPSWPQILIPVAGGQDDSSDGLCTETCRRVAAGGPECVFSAIDPIEVMELTTGATDLVRSVLAEPRPCTPASCHSVCVDTGGVMESLRLLLKIDMSRRERLRMNSGGSPFT